MRINYSPETVSNLPILSGDDSSLEPYRAFIFSNEDLGLLEENHILDDEKQIAAVCAGGDFPITAALNGAENIDAFDFNQFALFWAEFKIVAAQTLEYDDFIQMINDLQPEIYQKFRDRLSAAAREYFDAIIIEKDLYYGCEKCRKPTGRYACFACLDMEPSTRLEMSYLQNEETYKKLRQTMANLTLHFAEANYFFSQTDKVYDTVYLSNIMDWYLKEEERTNLIDNVLSHLNANGKIIYSSDPDNRLGLNEYIPNFANKVVGYRILRGRGNSSAADRGFTFKSFDIFSRR